LLLLVVVFLFDWRAAVVAAVTIPLSLFAAALALDLLGESMNLMVLGGLVAGLVLIIDDAVIGSHGVWRSLRQERGGDRTLASLVADAFSRAFGPLLFATLIILVVLIPLFALDGIAGAFFPSIVLAYAVAVVASALIAVIVAPAIALVISPGEPAAPRRAPLAGWLQQRYDSISARLLSAPMVSLTVVAVLAVVGLGLVTQLSRPPLLPAVKERNLLVQWEGAPGTSQPEMTRIVGQAATEIAALPGIANVGAHVGRAITSDQVVGINSAELWVTIDPKADYDAAVARLEDVIDGYPGLSRALLTYPEERVDHVLAGSSKDVVVRVYGEDLGALRAQADAVRNAMSGIEGVGDLVVEHAAEEPTVEVQVNLAAAQRAGIKPGDVRRAATTLLSGLLVGSLFQEQKVFEVVVWSTPETRSSVNSIRDLLIDTPSGIPVRLGEVADVRIAPNPSVVKRESVSRYIDVTANVNDRNIEAVEDDIESQVRKLNFPIEYHAEIVTDKAGGFRSIATSVLPYVLAAAAGAFLLLQAAFRSWRLAVISFLIIPVGLVGGALAVLIAGGEVTIGSYVGFLAVLGLSVRNAVALVGQLQQLERSPEAGVGAELAARAAGERFLPVLITGLAVALAMVPIVIAGSIPGLEVVQPMAIVILGGVISTTLLCLFLLPAIYLRFWSAPEAEVEAAS
jgi:Cu/Ag efflux pump CusA